MTKKISQINGGTKTIPVAGDVFEYETAAGVSKQCDFNALGAMQLIGEQSASGSTTTLSFTSIPGTYRALKLVGVGRSAGAGTGADGVMVQFNSDTGANYGQQRILSNQATVAGLQTTGGTSAQIGELPKAGDIANLPGSFEVTIPYYAGTTFAKTLLGTYNTWTNTNANTLYAFLVAGYWTSTAAITRIDVICTGSNFASGSKVALYGII